MLNNNKPETQQEGYNVLMGNPKGVQGSQGNPVTYAQYEAWAKAATNPNNSEGGVKITKNEWNQAARDFGWSKAAKRRYKKEYRRGGGPNLRAMTQGLQRRYYIADGKLHTEGEEDSETFNSGYNNPDNAKYRGTNKNALIKSYNDSVLNWRRQALETMYYDPKDGTYWTDNGYNNTGKVKLNDLDWFANHRDQQRQAQQAVYNDQVRAKLAKITSPEYLFSPHLIHVNQAAFAKESPKFTPENWKKFKETCTSKLLNALTRLKNSLQPEDNQEADAILAYLQQNKRVQWLDYSQIPTEMRYTGNQASTYSNQSRAFNLLYKQGGHMNYIIKASGGSPLRRENKLPGHDDWWSPDEGRFGKNDLIEGPDGQDYYRYTTPYVTTDGINQAIYVKRTKPNIVYWAKNGEPGANDFGDQIVNLGLANTDWDASFDRAFNRWFESNQPSFLRYREQFASPKDNKGDSGNSGTTGSDSNSQLLKQPKQPKQPKSNKGTKSQEDPVDKVFLKRGGTLNKINYFAPGGAVAAPAQQAGNSQIQAQVAQLVQSAIQGDQDALQAIIQVMQAAESDPQAAEIMNMIAQDPNAQQLAEILQSMPAQAGQAAQAPMSKDGSKISYLKTLKTGCPDGYEVSYRRQGGHICKECVKKSKKFSIGGTANTIAMDLLKSGAIDQTTYQGFLQKIPLYMQKVKEAQEKYHDHLHYSSKKALDIPTYSMPTYTAISNKKGGELKKLACGGKKKVCKTGAEIEKEKCGGKSKKSKKCEIGGILTLENLQKAYKNLSK